jgi:hypothetical protein
VYTSSSDLGVLAVRTLCSIACLFLFAFPLVCQSSFWQSYPNRSFASLQATMVDPQCGLQGKGTEEAAQNEVQNNFCASGLASITIIQMAEFQQKVQSMRSIPFGNSDLHPTGGGQWKFRFR